MTRSATHNSGLSFGLLLLNSALGWSLHSGIFYEWALGFGLLLLSLTLGLSLYQGRVAFSRLKAVDSRLKLTLCDQTGATQSRDSR